MGDLKDPIVGSEDIFFTTEDFEGLETLEIVPYTGEGKTSFASKDSKGNSYDIPKMKYLEQLGIETNPDWLTEGGEIKKEVRALFVTMFVVTGNILATESIRRTLRGDASVFEEILAERNAQLEENRVDRYGYRRELPDGSRVEDHYESLGLSSNPEKRVSKEELHQITTYVFSRLKKK